MQHSSQPITISILDTQRLFRDVARVALELDHTMFVVADAGTADEYMLAYASAQSDIALITPAPRLDVTIGVIREMKRMTPACKVLMLLDDEEPRAIAEMIRAGAIGYLGRRCSSEELRFAVKVAHSGAAVLPAEMLHRLVRHPETISLTPAIGQLPHVSIDR